METESQQVVFGKSIIVPSVRELVKEPITKVPPRYVYQQQDPPTVAAADIWLQPVPFIDLHSLLLGDSMGSELEKLHSACKDWGFFQVYTSEPNKGLGWAGLGLASTDSILVPGSLIAMFGFVSIVVIHQEILILCLRESLLFPRIYRI